MSINDPAAPTAAAGARNSYRWTMLAGVWLVYFAFGLVNASLAPLVRPITTELDMSHAAMGTVLGAWQLVFICSAAPCGAFLDRVGLRRGLLIGGLMVALSGALRGVSQDFTTLLLAVAVFGLGGPLVSVGAPKLISQWFEGAERGLAMGIYISGTSLGWVCALSLTNAVMMPLLDGEWRYVLFAYGAFVLAAALIWLAIASHPASRDVERHAASEPRRPQREVFGSLLRLRAVRLVLAMSVGIFFVNHALNQWLPEILQSGGMAAETAGFWAAIPTAVGIAAALLIPRFAVPSRRFAMLAILFVALGFATLLIHSGQGAPLAIALILQGIARSSMMTIAVLILMDARGVDRQNAGAANGLFFSTAEIGGVLGPLTLGYVSDLTGGFTAGLHLLSALCVGLLGMLWLLRREQRTAEAVVIAR